MRRTWSWAPLVAILASGCWSVGAGVTETVVSGDRVVIDGVANEPIGEQVVAAEVETPIGVFVVTTYDSAIGPCYDVRFPEGHSEAGCLRGSGIDPDLPVTGRPGDSIEGVNGGFRNLGLEDPASPVGTLHHGLVHPEVVTVTIEPDGSDEALGGFPVITAPNVEGLVVFVAWTPPGLHRYTLSGYGDDGCRRDAEQVALDGNSLDAPASGRDCDVRVPVRLRAPETGSG